MSIVTAAVAQEIDDPYGDYTEYQCQSLAQECIATYQAAGYATANQCFDERSQGRCPDRPYNPPKDDGPGGGCYLNNEGNGLNCA